MRYETMRLEVPGQQTGEALLQLYLLDSLEFAPERLRPMILVLPGGGYTRRSDREKEPIVMKFLSMGFHACVLEYSVAPNRFPVAVRELALAIAAIREHADEWHVKADAVIPCGFSAGGHLACSIGTFWNRPEVYEAVGKAPESVRPDGLILSYPVITSGEYRHEGSIVSPATPDVECSGTFRIISQWLRCWQFYKCAPRTSLGVFPTYTGQNLSFPSVICCWRDAPLAAPLPH